MKAQYYIRTAAQLSGLTPLTIRTWENRYQVVKPQRSKGNQRIYTDEDVVRLKILSRAVKKGYKIGNMVKLNNEKIESLILGDKTDFLDSNFKNNCDKALSLLDSGALKEEFEEASLQYGILESLDTLILPYMDQIGEAWQKGEKQIYHEHLATEAVKSYISGKLVSYHNNIECPPVIISTPSGQFHDMGASAAALAAAISGFRAIYLGPGLPADELIKAKRTHSVHLLILSIHFPGNPGKVRKELEFIRHHLLPEDVLFLGGASAPDYWEKEERIQENTLMALKNRLLQKRSYFTV